MSDKFLFPDPFTCEQFVKYIDRTEIKALVGSLAHTISENYKGQELVLVGILKGSVPFFADLVRKISGVNILIDFVKISNVGRTKDSEGTVFFTRDIDTDIRDRHVLLVGEIIDSGRALLLLKNRLLLADPKSLKIATLFDKPKRKTPLNADFIGKRIDDQFIVGYGLDLEEYGRNLHDIYFLKYPQ
jgi:hypoxanthine phosphoribosyltransferase